MSSFDAVSGAKHFLATAGAGPSKRQKNDICRRFNSASGCPDGNCPFAHVCNAVKPDGTVCRGTSHNSLNHRFDKPVSFKKAAALFKGGDKKKGNKGKGAKGGKGGKGGKGAK